MSMKRAYKRLAVKEASLPELRDRAVERGGRGTSVGLDVAKQEIVVCVRWGDGSYERPWSVENPSEIGSLIDLLQALKGVCDSLTVGLESTGTYCDSARYALTAAGLETHRVSGKAVSDYREIFDGVPSQHDGKDAAMIAELVAFGKGTSWPYLPLSEADQDIAHYVRRLDTYREETTRWQGRLEGMLARHWPEVSQLLDFESVTLLQILRHYGSPARLSADAAARAQLQQWGRAGLKPAKIDLLLESARSTRGLPMSAADLRWIQEIAAEIRLKLNHVEECEAQLKSLADEHPVIGPYTEAVGHVTLCVLLMAVGDPRDYTSSGAYLKAFGLNLKEVSSGNHQGRLSISKRGPSIARKWLYHWAMRAVQKPELRNWYDEFKKVGGKHHRNSEHRPMKGLVAVMRKLSRSLWHAVKHEEPFDYAKVFPGKPLAAIPHLVGTVEA